MEYIDFKEDHAGPTGGSTHVPARKSHSHDSPKRKSPSPSQTEHVQRSKRAGQRLETASSGDVDATATAGSPTDSTKPKRVRTGCLTCRERHLKCDEGTPDCKNCRKSNRKCKRGLKLNFNDVKVAPSPVLRTPEGPLRFEDNSREIAAEYVGGEERYPQSKLRKIEGDHLQHTLHHGYDPSRRHSVASLPSGGGHMPHGIGSQHMPNQQPFNGPCQAHPQRTQLPSIRDLLGDPDVQHLLRDPGLLEPPLPSFPNLLRYSSLPILSGAPNASVVTVNRWQSSPSSVLDPGSILRGDDYRHQSSSRSSNNSPMANSTDNLMTPPPLNSESSSGSANVDEVAIHSFPFARNIHDTDDQFLLSRQ